MTTKALKTQPGKLAGSARELLRSVDSMPNDQRRTMATISLAAAALLWVVGAPRLLTFLAFLPALTVGGLQVAKRHL
jgi:hypothetical protein